MSTPAASVPTQLVHTSGPLSTPEAYTVPGSLEIQLSSVAATFDGTAAGGTFEPTLSLYSKDGFLISRTKVGSSVAAGGTAVCTWIPFLRQAAVASPGTGITTAFRVTTASLQVCPDAAHTDLKWDQHFLTVGSPYTTADSKTFVLALGVWEIGYVMLVSAENNMARAGNSEIILTDTGGVSDFQSSIFFAENYLANHNESVVGVTTIDGTGHQIHLKSYMNNHAGTAVDVIPTSQYAYLFGNLLIGP